MSGYVYRKQEIQEQENIEAARLDKWEVGFRKFQDHMKATGNPNIDKNFATRGNFPLGWWVGYTRKWLGHSYEPKHEGLVQRLNDAGFRWQIGITEVAPAVPVKRVVKRVSSTKGMAWDAGVKEFSLYVETFGHPDVHYQYKSPSGFNLGTWTQNKRTQRRRGILSDARFEELDALGFRWSDKGKMTS